MKAKASYRFLFLFLAFVFLLMITLSAQYVSAKRAPMGHPSLFVTLYASSDPHNQYVIVEDEQTIEKLKNDIDEKLYRLFDMIVLPEIRKELDQKRNIYSDSYVEGIWGYYDFNESKLDILITKVPPQYDCNAESCAHRILAVETPAELRLSHFHHIAFSIAVYENMGPDPEYDHVSELIAMKASTETKILFSEAAKVIEDNKEVLLESRTAIEHVLLRQYEDISRVSVLFLPFEPSISSSKKPLDIVITSNSHYERSGAYNYSSQQSEQQTGPEILQECDELGIGEQDCTEKAILQKRSHQIPLSDEERNKIENQQNQINNTMYMIGIGAAIAGVIAFLTLRKRK
jgi:hypothetical protein